MVASKENGKSASTQFGLMAVYMFTPRVALPFLALPVAFGLGISRCCTLSVFMGSQYS